jgi:excisionase family DNA binding protein
MGPNRAATYTVEETAKLLGVGRNKAYEGVAAGEIPSIRIGKRILVPRIALEQMLAQPPKPKSAQVAA